MYLSQSAWLWQFFQSACILKIPLDFWIPTGSFSASCWVIALAPGIFFLFQKYNRKVWYSSKIPNKINLVIYALFLSAFLLIIIPPPKLVLLQEHTLSIHATGLKNDRSQDSTVEILKLRYADLTGIPPDAYATSIDWKETDGTVQSKGNAGSILTLTGNMPGGVILNINHSHNAGILSVIWDGKEQSIDLYAPDEKVIIPHTYASAFSDSSTLNKMVFTGFWLIYAIGLFFILFCGITGIQIVFGQSKGAGVIRKLIYLGLLCFFIYLKLSYSDFSAPRIYNDTITYVTTASQPILSHDFWFGLRPFTYPLFLATLNINNTNYLSDAMMLLVSQAQVWVSICCWSILAISVAMQVANKWIRPIVFGCILFFSLCPEISLWDFSLLSESISFSLYALLLSSWIWVFRVFYAPTDHWKRWVLLAWSIISAILFVFTRDVNMYLYLLCSVTFFLVSILLKCFNKLRLISLLLFIISVCIYLFHSFSFSSGDRWQIYIYNHLSMRILRDPQATQYFTDHGLPVSEKLTSTTTMAPGEYLDLFYYDPDLEAVRQWVNCCGMKTYLNYLLDDLPHLLFIPIVKYQFLLNGNNEEYRNPKYGILPISDQIQDIASILFYRNPWLLFLNGIVLIFGSLYLLIYKHNAIWLLISALIISIYPGMALVWYGDTLEIERHALQIGIQYRLAGLMIILFLFSEFIGWASTKFGANFKDNNGF